jgi:recombination associated protein RdgC
MLHTQVVADNRQWLTGWLAAMHQLAFTVDRDCELKAAGDEKSAVRYVRHPLDGDEVAGRDQIPPRLPANCRRKLALTWDERISFVLTEKLEIKRLAFLDVLKEEAEKSAEHADEQFDADFRLDDR